MITSNFRKNITDRWFSYLQIQICKEFEFLESNKCKFIRRDWNKKKKTRRWRNFLPFIRWKNF